MKTLIIISIILILINAKSFSQIPSDYPYKTLIDTSGNLYITGTNTSGDILLLKIISENNFVRYDSILNPGIDRGMDLAFDRFGDIYISGYIKEPNGVSNDIVLIKYDLSTRNILWYKKYGDLKYNDAAYGIVVDEDLNTYISGYVTKKESEKDFIVLKYDLQSNLVWSHQYNNPRYSSDDVSTDILIDNNYLYSIGYTYNGPRFNNDIIMFTYHIEDPDNNLMSIYNSKESETPTGVAIILKPSNPIAKSRAVVSGFSDNLILNQKNFFTVLFNDDEFSTVKWATNFNGSGNGTDIATSVAADRTGNIYVTGYSFRSQNNLNDFATIKYNKEDGSYGWTNQVHYFDYLNLNGNDRATSVKLKNDSVLIAGPSQNAANGYYIAKYSQKDNDINLVWGKTFNPAYTKWTSIGNMKSASSLEIDSSGNIYLITFIWDENHSYYAVRKYDASGNEIFTIDNNNDFQQDELISNRKEESEDNISLSRNYPNPFNPVTRIEYNLKNSNFVSLKIYDIAGKEISELVNENKTPGKYSVMFNGENFSSGIYYYKISVTGDNGHSEEIRKMLLVK